MKYPTCYAKFSSSSTSQTSQALPLNTLTRLRAATHDSGLSISIDSNERIQLHFSNSNAANHFAQMFGKVWKDPQNSNHFSIGVNQESFVFTQLKIPTHGAKQHAFGDSLKFDYASMRLFRISQRRNSYYNSLEYLSQPSLRGTFFATWQSRLTVLPIQQS